MAVDGWQRVEARPSWLDPPAPTWMPAATTAAYDSVIPLRTVEDGEPLPPLDPPHPRLERVLAWLVPWWAARRAAARRARYQRAARARITAARDAQGRNRDDLRSRYGPAWGGSRYRTR